MDASEVREIVAKYAPALMEKLGIPHWSIVFYYDLRESTGDGEFAKRGECIRQVRYDRATIRFDPAEFSDEQEVLKILRHELIHVVLAPFDLFWHAAEAHWQDDPVKTEIMNAVWDHVVEQAVINVRRVCEGHGPTELVTMLPEGRETPRPQRKSR
jgi:hypothetical protein